MVVGVLRSPDGQLGRLPHPIRITVPVGGKVHGVIILVAPHQADLWWPCLPVERDHRRDVVGAYGCATQRWRDKGRSPTRVAVERTVHVDFAPLGERHPQLSS